MFDGKKTESYDIINQRWSVFLPLLLAILFAVVKLIPFFTGTDGTSDSEPSVLFVLDTVSDCFSSAILPFIALAFVQQWMLGINVGLETDKAVLLLIASIIHFTFYILYLWAPNSTPIMYAIPTFSVVTFLALWNALNRFIKNGMTAQGLNPRPPSGSPQN